MWGEFVLRTINKNQQDVAWLGLFFISKLLEGETSWQETLAFEDPTPPYWHGSILTLLPEVNDLTF
jgi:hypothetical protein